MLLPPRERYLLLPVVRELALVTKSLGSESPLSISPVRGEEVRALPDRKGQGRRIAAATESFYDDRSQNDLPKR